MTTIGDFQYMCNQAVSNTLVLENLFESYNDEINSATDCTPTNHLALLHEQKRLIIQFIESFKQLAKFAGEVMYLVTGWDLTQEPDNFDRKAHSEYENAQAKHYLNQFPNKIPREQVSKCCMVLKSLHVLMTDIKTHKILETPLGLSGIEDMLKQLNEA